MSLHIPVKHITEGERSLVLYSGGGAYCLEYTSEGQRFQIKHSITDLGYATYLFQLLARDLNLNITN